MSHSALGQALILLALLCAAFGAVRGWLGGARRCPRAKRDAELAAYVFASAVLLANGVMVRALITHDFSVAYVARVGSRATPTLFSAVSLWSSLEGSILFWGAILGIYVAAFAATTHRRYAAHTSYALGVMLTVAVFFVWLIAGPAHPFSLVSPAPHDGPGPNPLLQNDILMVTHPPMLYLGYVGMTVPFGIVLAALLRGELPPGWLGVLRRWTLIPWTFLTVGIVLGGWWAYEVLGWGGYWAWDPVENASLLPWLAATAYLHSTVVHERRGILKTWTVVLNLSAFMLTILGTFMTRSGVFNSVHSFTKSSIGPLFLAFLGCVMVTSLLLVSLRGDLLEAERSSEVSATREVAFLLNNVLFAVFTLTVLLGTIFPLITEAVRGEKLSVGEPYFNRMAAPLGIALVLLLGTCPALPWGRPRLAGVARQLTLPLCVGAATVVACIAAGLRETLAITTFGLCAFAGVATLREMARPVILRIRAHGEGPWTALTRVHAVAGRRLGGSIVHLAVLVTVAAIAASQTYKITKDVSLAAGESTRVGDYTFEYEKAGGIQEPHRFSVTASVSVHRHDTPVGTLTPALNYYPTQREPIGKPYVKTVGVEDVYLSLLSIEKDGSRVGLRIFVVPLASWLWATLPLFVLGPAIAVWPRRRRPAETAAP